MLHTDRLATAACSECHRPLCQECTQVVANKPVCQSCIAAIRSRVATQLNAEAAARPVPPPMPPQAPNAPYGAPGAYPPVGQQPAAPGYGAPRMDLAGNVYEPQPGSQPPAAPPYGAPQNPAYPGAQQTPGYGAPTPAPYGMQPGYGAPAQPPYGQPGYGAQQPAGQTGYNPYGTAPQQGGSLQQPGYPNSQAPYGTAPQSTLRPTSYSTPPAKPTSAGGFALAVVFGMIAAVVGGGLYIWIIDMLHMSIGYMAIGVGFLVGWAVKMGTRAPSQAAGILAVALTVLAILPARLLIYLNSSNPGNILFTLLFLFIGCRFAYSVAASGNQ